MSDAVFGVSDAVINAVRARDIMEPVTYLSGLSMVILGYLW